MSNHEIVPSSSIDESESLNNEKLSRAEIPILVTKLVETLDKHGFKPNSEVVRHEFEGSIVTFCAYPELLREYFSITGICPSSIDVTMSEVEDSLDRKPRNVVVTIACDDESFIKIEADAQTSQSIVLFSSSTSDNFNQQYDIERYAVGQMLISLSLRPNDMEDIHNAHMDRTRLDPVDPLIFGLLRTALQSQAHVTEKTRKHVLSLHNDDDFPISMLIDSGTYADGNNWYDMSLRQEYQDSGTVRFLKLNSKDTYVGNDARNGRKHVLEGYYSSQNADYASDAVEPLIAGLYIETALARAQEYPYKISSISTASVQL
jgi:hypothetical protein